MSRRFDSATALADALIGAVGKKIVLGLPVGIGKAVHVADALFERATLDDSISLTIFSGLTLEPPQGRSEVEKRFLLPLVDRLYSQWPTPAYATAVRQGALPANIQVREFYLRPGAYLHNAIVQRSYTSINYSQVVAELLDLGVNVIGQLVATRPESPARYSLSSNPEITLDLLPRLADQRNRGHAFAMVGQVNRFLPYMTGEAELSEQEFDFVLDAQEYDFPLFTLPNRRVLAADYATAMHVASLIPDGGTLQVGIGSLSDAVAHCLILRHESPDVFGEVLQQLPGGARSSRRSALPIESDPFNYGLFASSELMSDALFWLFKKGLIKRPADESDKSVIHAGFFIGSTSLYESLRALSEADRALIKMTSISHVNTLFGDEENKRRQRRHSRFVNETMMTTLLGAAVSDALEDGRVVSGVGGQFDFVSMAQALDDAQSILMCRARRLNDGIASSNIRWSYGHTTVPRHHRDVFVSEYGIAATRGKTDEQTIDAMLGIADSEFQQRLISEAKRAGKLRPNYSLDAEARNNTPDALGAVFEQKDIQPYFPAYPLGTDLTATEQQLVDALDWLKTQTARPWANIRTLSAGLVRGGHNNATALARMGLDQASSVKERALRRLIDYALDQKADRSEA
jgi:acyl-CoA hydrolase